MVTTALFLATSSLLALVAAAPAAGPGYLADCRDIVVLGNAQATYIEGRCRGFDGKDVHSILNLNRGGTNTRARARTSCIANDGGVLEARSDGDFTGSCRDGAYDFGDGGSTELQFTCTVGDGSAPPKTSSVHLGDFVSNQNGLLSCFHHDACPVESAECTDKPAGVKAVLPQKKKQQR
ncbi:hypothetical protein F4780DRAFT_782795 [Xylariomycetidae sp. FL0641]|nr:hypothetical protein F4780DRAFT_782795 [Xylariomycetidae sp. FL0641]